MQLTKKEVTESQMLVTTPEKYDVITRKGGDGSLITLVSLIIIDEVHLLADERGAVIETIVARTQRYVESSQRQVRIVGLSATLPNYKDVAKFLGVNSRSCYFFGPEYRPVPLDQTFIGLTEKNRTKLKKDMAEQTYIKMISALERGKQVMIFSRSLEVQNLFTHAMGIHHAGMLRPDRTLTEQLFESGIIKVLMCTATLAWGVNLPAHTVIIKGTELYQPERGGFVDLSILDILQIFGRAGRPQYAETGHAVLLTPHKTLNMYLALADHLNAEVVNGTVMLDSCMMLRYDVKSGNLGVTDLGRIASHYYIKHGTIEGFNNMLNTAQKTEKECLHALCSASEFDQLKVRPEETAELERLKKSVPFKTKSIDDTAGKVSVLLQNFCRQERVESFTLQSDTNYIATNAGRIARALFEINVKRGWSAMARLYLELSKSIDRRMNMHDTPLRQFNELSREIIHRIETTNSTPEKIIDMDAAAVGGIVHNQKAGKNVLRLAQRLPHLYVEADVKPITRGILRIILQVYIDFQWDMSYHGLSEPFHIWMEDVIDGFQHLILPERMPPHTPLLDLHPVPKSALGNPVYESLFPNFTHFNPIQSQTFHVLFHTDQNVLVGAPTGSGKTIISELAILRLLITRPKAKTIYVAPMKALARERLHDWQRKFGLRGLELKVLELTGDASPDARALREGHILIVTPEKWDSISRGWQSANRDYVRQVELVILDEVHLLGVDRGPVLEVIVSRMRFIAAQMNRDVRFIGLSTALANPRDLADWLGIGEVGVYNFRPSVRPVPMTIHIQAFPEKNYCPRMASMNKPCYASIMEHSPTKPTLIFVSSRRQTRLTALDLIAYCAADLDNPKRFLSMPEEEVIVFGVGIHHAGLDNNDRLVVEELFLNNKIQVLVCTSTLAWGVNLPCHLVIVKGTEYYDGKINRYVDMPVTDVLQMMGRAGRPQFDDSAVAVIMAHEPKKNFYKKFLHEPFPVESSLQNYLHDHLNAEIANGTLHNLEDCIEFLTWTYYFRRLVYNPSYYNLEDASPEGIRTHLINMVKYVCFDLQEGHCLNCTDDDGNIIEDDREKEEVKDAAAFERRLNALLSPIQPQAPKNIPKIAVCICESSEFSELPVRHNEEILNSELAQSLPWNAVKEEIEYESPHVKAFLLLQAHCTQSRLPISDYINDTKSVLDQMPRVLGALVEVAVMKKAISIIESLAKLSQMIAQGVMFSQSEITQLPYVTQEVASWFDHTLKLTCMKDFRDKKKMEAVLNSLNNNTAGGRGGGGTKLKSLFKSDSALKKFQGALKSFPQVNFVGIGVKRTLKGLAYQSCDLSGKRCTAIMNSASVDIVGPSDDYGVVGVNLTFQLQVENKAMQASTHARQYSNGHHYKPKDAGWWILISYTTSTKSEPHFVVFKRVQSIRNGVIEVTVDDLQCSNSSSPGMAFTVKLISDTFLGADAQAVVVLSV
eukprot:GSChrysophyteH1.ASY1.ANO1.3170.1 assembled CDS